MKFSVGDKVMVLYHKIEGIGYGGRNCYCVINMKEFQGKVFTISRLLSSHINLKERDVVRYGWHKKCLGKAAATWEIK